MSLKGFCKVIQIKYYFFPFHLVFSPYRSFFVLISLQNSQEVVNVGPSTQLEVGLSPSDSTAPDSAPQQHRREKTRAPFSPYLATALSY